LVKIYRRPKRATQLMRLLLLHCAQTIITRSCPYSSRFSSLTQSTEPAQNEALLHYFRTIMTEERLYGLKVQNRETVEKKCICGGYRKIVSVNHVDVFVGPTRECEAWQKIIRRLRWRCVTKVQVQNATFRVAYPTYVSQCLTLRAQCLSFMQIGPFENELHISSAPVKFTLLTNRSLERCLLDLFLL
ncbi:hypothetical protein T12_9945, partial [Trichinella patagoniensis]